MKIEKFKIISLKGNEATKFENIGIIEENLIIFDHIQREISVGSPVFLSGRKNFLVGIVNCITSTQMIVCRFNDLNQLNNYKLISLINLSIYNN